MRGFEPAVPRGFETIVLRCLEKEPSKRFGSMDELGQALDRFLGRRTLLTRALRILGVRPRRFPNGPRIHPEEDS